MLSPSVSAHRDSYGSRADPAARSACTMLSNVGRSITEQRSSVLPVRSAVVAPPPTHSRDTYHECSRASHSFSQAAAQAAKPGASVGRESNRSAPPAR